MNSGSDTEEEEIVERGNHEEWCMCDNCTNMDTHVERVCCHDLTPCLNKLVEAITEYNHVVPYMCLCEHPGFILNCLYREVLDNAWLSYKQQYGQNGFEDVNINKRHRHVAYRQLARFLFGIVGRYNRYALPSCAVANIRKRFPNIEIEADYTGLKLLE